MQLAFQAFQPTLQEKCLSVLTDYTMAMFYINKQEGTPLSVSGSTKPVGVLHSPVYSPEAFYLPGFQNTLADHLRRSFVSHHEWSICPDVLNVVFQKWGFPQVDLFMIKLN